MKTRSEIEQEVIEAVAQQAGKEPGDIRPDTSIYDTLGLDSLDAVEISMEIEDRLDITIPDGDLDQCRTVSELVDLAERRLR